VALREITFDSMGKVATLNASFVQHREGEAPALRGKIHYYA